MYQFEVGVSFPWSTQARCTLCPKNRNHDFTPKGYCLLNLCQWHLMVPENRLAWFQGHNGKSTSLITHDNVW